MLKVLIQAGCYIAIIILGIVLKKAGLFKREDFGIFSKISLKITLPAAIITNFANKELDPSMLLLALMALCCGCFYIGLGFLLNLKNSKERRAFEMVNLSGYNIGCFALPFVQGFLSPVGVIATCLFDIGNGFIGLGGAYSLASLVKDGNRFSLKRIVSTMLHSVPFLVYMIMPALCLLRVPIPYVVTNLAGIVGSANAFISMFAIGIGFHLAADRSQVGRIIRMVAVRFGVAAVLAALVYFLLPFEMEVKKAVMIVVFSPIASAAPAFTGEMKSDVGLASAVNSVSIVCSILLIVSILVLIP